MPVIAILRGVKHDEVAEIGDAIYRAGIGIIEVPLNSPEPFKSITNLANALGKHCVVGSGTTLSTDDVKKVADAGGNITVSPDTNTNVIKKSLELNMVPMPGWATLTEAFTAYNAGARYLKLFPAATYGPGHVKGCKAVLPKDARVLAVGGAGASNAAEWLNVGVDGFGIGTELYSAGLSPDEVFNRAEKVVTTIQQFTK